jgi:hypothetical protein
LAKTDSLRPALNDLLLRARSHVLSFLSSLLSPPAKPPTGLGVRSFIPFSHSLTPNSQPPFHGEQRSKTFIISNNTRFR